VFSFWYRVTRIDSPFAPFIAHSEAGPNWSGSVVCERLYPQVFPALFRAVRGRRSDISLIKNKKMSSIRQ
jgi:hypothetical protein